MTTITIIIIIVIYISAVIFNVLSGLPIFPLVIDRGMDGDNVEFKNVLFKNVFGFGVGTIDIVGSIVVIFEEFVDGFEG